MTNVVSPQMPNPYGPNITLADAKKVASAAAEQAIKMKINVIIAIVDAGGNLTYLERFDRAQFGSIDVAIHKAKCAVAYKRPTKAFEDVLGSGRTALLTLDGIIAVEGGVPIILDEKIVGAIGVSGGTSQQDGQIAVAGTSVVR
jgi:glc operon protein GlcG